MNDRILLVIMRAATAPPSKSFVGGHPDDRAFKAHHNEAHFLNIAFYAKCRGILCREERIILQSRDNPPAFLCFEECEYFFVDVPTKL
jgi:hypothetical protein